MLGQCRHAGRDLSVDRDVSDPNLLHGRNKRARLAGVTIEESFTLKGGNVLHDRRLAGETKMTLDFPRAGSDTFLPLFALNKIEHALLAIGQHAARWSG